MWLFDGGVPSEQEKTSRKSVMRIALCGPSGTGKTTLAKWLEETRELDFNPVGSRSVAKDMGFDNPYDVDKAGKRGEFQRRLLTDKVVWEMNHDSFITDRTTLDNLAYTMLHDVKTVTKDILDCTLLGMKRYTHVIYCPHEAFINTAGDPNRVAEMAYHKVYDATLFGLMSKFTMHLNRLDLVVSGQGERREWIDKFLAKTPSDVLVDT